MIEIITPSRLHMTLIDLNASLGRVDGGIGITLQEPSMCIRATRTIRGQQAECGRHDGCKDTAVDIIITGQSEHAQRMYESAQKVSEAFGTGGVSIDVVSDYPSHTGLGSGTQASLAAAYAVCELYDIDVPVRRLCEIVGRGGTSGVGVAAFEQGGFILDGGHRFSEKGGFKPSAASVAKPAPVILRRDFPDWGIVLAIPDLKGASSAKEVDIFKQECPIPLHEVQELSHIILMQLLPALVEEDIVAFGDAVNRIQDVGFKKREVALQHPIVREVMELFCNEGGYGAGMSSFGPAVYAFCDNPDRMRDTIAKKLDESVGGECIIAHANNSGATIRKTD